MTWIATVAPGLAPRLFAELPPRGSARTLAAHRRTCPAPPSSVTGGDPRIIDELERAGLTGRGGAGFPTAVKWRAVAAGHLPVVVVNGSEGEPASGKDAILLARLPHLVLDGALFAARGVGADRIVVCVGDPSARAGVLHALAERRSFERTTPTIEIADVPDRYVAGEERSLVHLLNGGEALPTAMPPRPFERGVARRPTLIQNVETLAHVAMIMNHGAAWFREEGTPSEPGTRLISLSGAVPEPVVCEVPVGAPLRQVVEANGGDLRDVSGVLIGGNFGTWLDTHRAFDARLSAEALAPLGAGAGSGVVHLLGRDRCGISTVARIAGWFAQESAGQCGPCVYGLAAIADALRAVDRCEAPGTMLSRIERWTAQVEGRGACRLPDGAVGMVRSGLEVFADEVRAHRAGRCTVGSLVGAGR